MRQPRRGEVWLMDLGYVAKVRPCLNIGVEDRDRVLLALVPHTTSSRGSRFEIEIPVKYLKDGVFDVQQVTSGPLAKAVKKLGVLNHDQLKLIEDAIRFWLGL